jgi:hypothetical protein
MLMSKKMYVGIYAASFGLCLLTIIALGAMFVFGSIQKSNYAVDMAIAFAARIGIYALLQFVIAHTVCSFLLLARMWGAIQDGQTTITVGKAVGFLFIPLFNFYWIFRVWRSYPTEYNNYIDRYALPVPHLAGKVFAAYPILLLAGILFVPLLALPFVFIAVISKTYDAVNVLGEAVQERRNQLVQSPIHYQMPPRRIQEQSVVRG